MPYKSDLRPPETDNKSESLSSYDINGESTRESYKYATETYKIPLLVLSEYYKICRLAAIKMTLWPEGFGNGNTLRIGGLSHGQDKKKLKLVAD